MFGDLPDEQEEEEEEEDGRNAASKIPGNEGKRS